MSSAITAFNILQLLTLPTAQEVNDDFSQFNSNYNRLMTKLFNVKTYDRMRQPEMPVNLGIFIIVDHVENVDEYGGTVSFHGTLLCTWRDDRLVWTPADYGNMNQTYISMSLGQLWVPPLYFRTLVRATTRVLQYHSTEVILDYTGFITALSSISVTAECRLDYTIYPYDNQTCSIFLMAPMMNSERILFTEAPVFLRRDSLYGSDGNNSTNGAYFKVVGTDSDRWYSTPYGLTDNETLYNFFSPRNTSTLLRFEMRLTRNPSHYMTVIALPLFASSVCAYVVVSMTHSTVSVIWLAVCLIMQGTNIFRMVEELPPAYNTLPLCARLAGILFIITFLLLVYRFILVFFYSQYKKGQDDEKLQRLRYAEYSLATLLAISGIINLWFLAF